MVHQFCFQVSGFTVTEAAIEALETRKRIRKEQNVLLTSLIQRYWLSDAKAVREAEKKLKKTGSILR